MKLALVGHRGVGKTTVLKALDKLLKPLYPALRFYDLDQMIEAEGRSVLEIFESDGEKSFRELEQKVFNTLHAAGSDTTDLVLSLGAGFEGVIPEDFEVIWIRRESDKQGRIFLDRPRLNGNLSALEEWQQRFPKREEKYRSQATQILTLPEGDWALPEILAAYFSYWFPKIDQMELRPSYFATLLPEDGTPAKALYKRAARVEVRDDLVLDFSAPSIYFSHRNGKVQNPPPHPDLIEDWDLALGDPPRDFWSGSYHGPTLPKENKHFEVLKWAPEVLSMAELFQGHQWWTASPNTRCFLPRSHDGRWRWYRQLFGPKMKIHFLRDELGSSLDQPFEYEHFLNLSKSDNGFAAVLGQDVSLSLSPSFHHKRYGLPFCSINIDKEDFGRSLQILIQLGLRFAAVTSPFKEEAFRASDDPDEISIRLKSSNTLVIHGGKIKGFNTDYVGLEQALKNHIDPKLPICVWGGGGVLSSLKALLPNAQFVKAREGTILSEPTQVVWASIRSSDVKLPNPLKYVRKVIDLNYSGASMGLELAEQAGCEYVSGLEYFQAQGLAQQDIWRKFL